MIKYLDKDKDLQDELVNDISLVVFSATWCGPCQLLAETIETYAKKNDISITKVNVDDHGELAQSYGVMVVPTVMLFKGKELMKQATGYMNEEELASFINE